mgnify:CR=1 FL=1
MSQVLDTMRTRRSIRRFRADMVPREILEQVMEAGTYAASGRGSQSPVIIAVTNREIRDKLSRANAAVMGTDTDPFYGAPVILIVLADKAWPTHVYDGSLVMGNLMLAAHDRGLGSCWIHRAKEVFQQPEWKAWLASLGLEGEYEGIGHCAIGYVDGTYPETPPRKGNRIYFAE